MANACASHGSLNTGPSSLRGSAGMASRFTSDKFEVVIPKIQINAVNRRGVIAPYFGGVKPDAVQVLGLFILLHCVGIGKGKNAMITVNDAASPSCITRESRM